VQVRLISSGDTHHTIASEQPDAELAMCGRPVARHFDDGLNVLAAVYYGGAALQQKHTPA